MLSCEHCEIFKNTYFDEHLRSAASRLGLFEIFNCLTQGMSKLNKTKQKQPNEVFCCKDVLKIPQNYSKARTLDSLFNKVADRRYLFLIALQASGSESLYETACIRISFFIFWFCLFVSLFPVNRERQFMNFFFLLNPGLRIKKDF